MTVSNVALGSLLDFTAFYLHFDSPSTGSGQASQPDKHFDFATIDIFLYVTK